MVTFKKYNLDDRAQYIKTRRQTKKIRVDDQPEEKRVYLASMVLPDGGQCKYIYSDHKGDYWCDKQAIKNRSWCLKCKNIVYIKSHDKND